MGSSAVSVLSMKIPNVDLDARQKIPYVYVCKLINQYIQQTYINVDAIYQKTKTSSEIIYSERKNQVRPNLGVPGPR